MSPWNLGGLRWGKQHHRSLLTPPVVPGGGVLGVARTFSPGATGLQKSRVGPGEQATLQFIIAYLLFLSRGINVHCVPGRTRDGARASEAVKE